MQFCISHFGFEDRILILIVPVPGHLLLFTFDHKLSLSKCFIIVNFDVRRSQSVNLMHFADECLISHRSCKQGRNLIPESRIEYSCRLFLPISLVCIQVTCLCFVT